MSTGYKPLLTAAAAAIAMVFPGEAAAQVPPTCTVVFGGSTCTVNNAADSGTGTLRDALTTIANDCGCFGAPYTVRFSFPGITTISPVASPLVVSACQATIDGYDQTAVPATGATANTIADIRSGSNASPRIIINGAAVSGPTLIVASPNSAVKGLVFQNHSVSAIQVQAQNVGIFGNFIGTNEFGNACAGATNGTGIELASFADNYRIGSASPADRNIIGCNLARGISDSADLGGTYNNLIGTGAGGAALPNGTGVHYEPYLSLAGGNVLGNSSPGFANVIARNTGPGVVVSPNRYAVYIGGNDIFLNGSLGIDLGNDGPTPANSLFSPNASLANGGINSPRITFVRYDAANTTVDWSYNGFINSSILVDFFSNPAGLGLTQGARWFGNAGGFSSSLGALTGSTTFTGNQASPTATARADFGTSEFSPPASLDVTPKSLTFSGTVGTTSAPQVVTFSNIGSAPITIGPPLTIGDFAAVSTCDGITPVPPGGTCTASVTFTPIFLGNSFDYLDMPTSGTGGGRGVGLEGNAVPVPVLSVSPAGPVNFGSQAIGASSPPVTFTMTNSGDGLLDVLSVTPGGPFAGSFQLGTDGCTGITLGTISGQLAPALVAKASVPMPSCDVTVFMQPQAAGALAATLDIQSTATNPLVQVALAGTGTTVVTPIGTASLSNPGPIDFGARRIGTQSPTQVITLTNTGAGPLTVGSALLRGTGFVKMSDSCTGVPIPSSLSCSIALAFAPAFEGTYRTIFEILSDGSNPQVQVELRGTGTPLPVGLLAASTGTVSFGTQPVGITTNPQTVQVTNTGTLPVVITAVRAIGDYAQTNDCGALSPGQGCRVFVTFTPTAQGDRSGNLVFDSDASNSLVVSLQGAGSPAPVPAIELTPSAVSFGTALQGAGGGGTAINLRNSGGASLTLTGIYTVGDFGQSHNCPTSLPPGASCTVTVSFVPQVTGSRSGKLVIESNAPAGVKEAPLSGTGCAVPSRAGARLARPNCG